jgi:hypothetical protein
VKEGERVYTEYLERLAEISKILVPLAEMDSQAKNGMPVPYVSGKIQVLLDGERVGYYMLEDGYVNFEAGEV